MKHENEEITQLIKKLNNLSKSDKNYFQNMDAMIVGEIVNCESSN